jgi:chromate transporter
MVVQFVGFMGAFRQPGTLPPFTAGMLAGLLTTWVTFVPCFLWIFLGAPYIETLRTNRALAGALAAITASVVGVILNLAVWFALHVLFSEVRDLRFGMLHLDVPVLETLNVPSLALTIAAMFAIFRLRIGMIPVLAGSTAAGIAFRALAGTL